MSGVLVPFLSQPIGVAWPTQQWPTADLDKSVDKSIVSEVLSRLFDHGVDPGPGEGISLATVVIHKGYLVLERYGRQPHSAFGEGQVVDAETPLISWSMAKSMTQAALGMLVDEGRIDISTPVHIQDWQTDDRRDISLENMLQMRDGLDFIEEYVADESGTTGSDVIEMLFGSGASDVAAYARARPLKNAVGSTWSYSSGTTNIISRLMGDTLGGGEMMLQFLRERLFGPLGMGSAVPQFDDAGTFIGSSYVFATARDFAKFGYLYLRGGMWGDGRLLSREWVESARTQHATDAETGHGYGSHWWIWKSIAGIFAALGYEGQRTIVVPQRDLVVVHLGKWSAPTQLRLDAELQRLIEAFPLCR